MFHPRTVRKARHGRICDDGDEGCIKAHDKDVFRNVFAAILDFFHEDTHRSRVVEDDQKRVDRLASGESQFALVTKRNCALVSLLGGLERAQRHALGNVSESVLYKKLSYRLHRE
jgi:hypothetical protein